jgi:L-amino acid N-acyltransferase YncA
MKTVHAIWEKRNLDCEVYETAVDTADDRERVHAELEHIPRPSMHVCNLPVGRADLYELMSTFGYVFFETKLHTKVSVKALDALPAAYRRSFGLYTVELAKDFDALEEVIQEINKGMFSTDRIALDPRFGLSFANRRYANWVRDEFEGGQSMLFRIVEKASGQGVGFHLIRKPAGTAVTGLVGGLYVGAQDAGLGAVMSVAAIEATRQAGAKILISKVSANNIPVIRCHEACGNSIVGAEYVFVGHRE